MASWSSNPDQELFYITYEVVDQPSGRVPSMAMRFSYSDDPYWTGERSATTKEEIAAGNRTSTVRTALTQYGVTYEVGKVYSTSGTAPYIRITNIENLGPAKSVPLEKWQQISQTERWSVEYLTEGLPTAVTTENTQKISEPQTGRVEAAIAVSSVDQFGKVKGGTGYATELALIEGIPVYIFDQDTMTWLTASSPQSSKSGWTKVDAPPSTFKSIAGIGATGAREPLTEQGKKAIRDYVSTLSTDTVIHSGGAIGADSTFESAHAARGGKVVAHSFEGHETSSKNTLVHSKEELSIAAQKMNAVVKSLGRSISSSEYVRSLINRNTFQILPGLISSSEPQTRRAPNAAGRIIFVDDLSQVPEGEIAVWGSNTTNMEKGGGKGQAAAARGRSGWIAAPTKLFGKMSEDAFLTDADYASWPQVTAKTDVRSRAVTKALQNLLFLPHLIEAKIKQGKDVYIPSDGLGSGLAELPTRAPTIFNGIADSISNLTNRYEVVGAPSEKSGIKVSVKPQGWKSPTAEFGVERVKASEFLANRPAGVGTVYDENGVATRVDLPKPQNEGPGLAKEVAVRLNEFADMRKRTATTARFTGGERTSRYGQGDPSVVRSQIDRAVGTMGAFGRYHDSSVIPTGINAKRTIPSRIADVAQLLGGEITKEFFDGNFIASETQVAAVFHDMFIALRELRGEMPDGLKAEISALVLEMSRILHDYSTPRSRAIFRKLWKKSRGPGAAKFGLTADAAEIAAQGAVMPEVAPEGAKAKLQRVAAAQVGQVPQMSMGEEPSVTRSLRDEIANRRLGDNVFELQRFVDANGVFEGTGDTATIDIYGRIEYVGPKRTSESSKASVAISKALERFLNSPIGFLADDMLDINRHLNQFNSEPYKLTQLENRSEFGSPIQIRTDVKYAARISVPGQTDVTPESVRMDQVVDSVDRLNSALQGKLVQIFVEGDKPVQLPFPEQAAKIIEARNARVTESRNALVAQFGEEFADAYMKSEEGIARFGKIEKVPKTITLSPGSDIVVPEQIAAMIGSTAEGTKVRLQPLSSTDFALRFTPVVSPKYIVLRNGTIVSARSAEGGLIEHRRVYPYRVVKSGPSVSPAKDGGAKRSADGTPIIRLGGEISIEPMDSTQYRITDPNQRYDEKEARATQERFVNMFSEGGSGFEDNEAGALYEQVVEDIRTDAYAALEILAINGDRFPQLEADLIASILEVGDFRVDRAPMYVRSRGGAVEPTETGSKDIGGGSKTMKGRTLLSTEAMRLPLDVLSKLPLASGTVADILHQPEVFGHLPKGGVQTGAYHFDSIIRGLRLLQKMSTIAGVQIGYGGIVQSPAGYETERGRVLVPRDNFWMLADRDVYDENSAAAAPESLAEQSIMSDGKTEEVLASRAIIAGEDSAKAIEVIRGTDRAAILAARAAVEVARGLLGAEWTVDLDPQFHRDRFPEVIVPGRSTVDQRYYPITRLLDSVAQKPNPSIMTPGGSLFTMRDSGALSAKADKFFNDLANSGLLIGPSSVPANQDYDTWIGEDGRIYTDRVDKWTDVVGDDRTTTTRMVWDEQMGWTNVPKPGDSGPVGERLTSTVGLADPRSQMALTVEAVKAVGAMEKLWVINSEGRAVFTSPQPVITQPTRRPGEDSIKVEVVKTKTRAAERAQIEASTEEIDKKIIEAVKNRGFDSADLDRAAIRKELRKKAWNDILAVAREVHTKVVPVEEGYTRVYNEKTPGEFKDYSPAEFRQYSRDLKAAREERTGTVYDAADGMEITPQDEYGYSVFDDGDYDGDYTAGVEEVVSDTRALRTNTSPRRVATVVAIALQNKGQDSAETAIRKAIEGLSINISDKRSLDGFFRSFWKHFSEITIGRDYAKSVELVKAIGANLPDNYVERALATDLEVEGKPALGVVSKNLTTGKEEVITVTRKKGKLVNAELVLPILENMQAAALDGDNKFVGPFYEIFADIFGISIKDKKGNKKIIKIESGPMTLHVQKAIEAIRKGEIPEFDTNPLEDRSRVTVQMGSGGEIDAPSVSATGRPKSTTAETGDFSYDDLDSGYWDSPDTSEDITPENNGDPEINYAVKQGKLMGLLTPDRLLPKMSPGLRSFDMGIRTPVGGSVAGAAIDFATLGLSGNLNPQNALFTGALNATNLLTKSPLKATAIGAVASLGATAATGGDIGRTVFNLLGSIGGGALGAVATGGIGSLGGSVAGGFVADELWKALFGQGDNWSIRRQTSPSINTPDINIRVP